MKHGLNTDRILGVALTCQCVPALVTCMLCTEELATKELASAFQSLEPTGEVRGEGHLEAQVFA